MEEVGCEAARSVEGLNDLDLELLRRHNTSTEFSFPECFEVLQSWFQGERKSNGAFRFLGVFVAD